MGGATGNDAGSLTANFYTGEQVSETEFLIDPVSLVNDEPLIYFEDTTITDGLYMTSPADLSLISLSMSCLSNFASHKQRYQGWLVLTIVDLT